MAFCLFSFSFFVLLVFVFVFWHVRCQACPLQSTPVPSTDLIHRPENISLLKLVTHGQGSRT